jgi:hypothetical protein
VQKGNAIDIKYDSKIFSCDHSELWLPADVLLQPDLSILFEKRLADICTNIADVETRCSLAEARARVAEARAEDSELNAQDYAERCASCKALQGLPWHVQDHTTTHVLVA